MRTLGWLLTLLGVAGLVLLGRYMLGGLGDILELEATRERELESWMLEDEWDPEVYS